MDKKTSEKKIKKEYLILSITLALLLVGCFFVWPTYIHKRCESKAWAYAQGRIGDYPDADKFIKIYEYSYGACTHYWGL